MHLYAFTSALSLAFRKVSVCVCLYGLGIALSHWSFRRGASSLLPLHQPLPSPQPSQKNDNPIASHHILASLVKGRWIDGKPQTVVLLRFTCDTPAFFIHQTFLPSRRRDCSCPEVVFLIALALSLFHITKCINLNSEPEKCYPSKSTTTLAFLVKGRWIDGCCFIAFACSISAFLCYKQTDRCPTDTGQLYYLFIGKFL